MNVNSFFWSILESSHFKLNKPFTGAKHISPCSFIIRQLASDLINLSITWWFWDQWTSNSFWNQARVFQFCSCTTRPPISNYFNHRSMILFTLLAWKGFTYLAIWLYNYIVILINRCIGCKQGITLISCVTPSDTMMGIQLTISCLKNLDLISYFSYSFIHCCFPLYDIIGNWISFGFTLLVKQKKTLVFQYFYEI